MYLRQTFISANQWGILRNAQYLFLEIVKVGIQGEIGRVITCTLGKLGREIWWESRTEWHFNNVRNAFNAH